MNLDLLQIARQRHLAYQQREEAQRQEEKRQEEAEKKKQKEAQEEAFTQLLEKQQVLTSFLTQWKHNTPITHNDISELRNHLVHMVPLGDSLGRLSEIQTHITTWIEEVNMIREIEPPSLEEIRLITPLLKDIFALCHVDIHIEMMDTTNDRNMLQQIQQQEDESYALELLRQQEQEEQEQQEQQEEQEQQEPVFPNLPRMPIPLMQFVADPAAIDVPVCSLTRRIGLTVPQLRGIAIEHGIPAYGSKAELAVRLSTHGLVRIVLVFLFNFEQISLT